MGSRRISKELNDLSISPPEGCRAYLLKDTNLYIWKAIIEGPDESPYENGKFKLTIHLPVNYPLSPPKVKFDHKVYHPNISMDGRICLDILAHNWSPILTIDRVLISIRSLLTDPNCADPFNQEASKMYISNRNKFNQIAKELTKKFAMNKYSIFL